MDNSSYISQFLLRKRKVCDVSETEDAQTKLKEIRLDTTHTGKCEDFETTAVRVMPVLKGETFLHEVALPPGLSCPPLKAIEEPIIKFPFPLDDFQKRAILCIHNGYSVLVSAHTSAGKTAIAEYAIAKALADKQRVIYTTPIKALSNQKYREFATSGKFQDVGLLTGDVSINPHASLVVMTTEILRLMLYRSHDTVRETGWAIFDEVHYIRDAVRGVVWEECLALLPPTVRNVFLSATIPNANEFAQWVVTLQCSPPNPAAAAFREQLPCHVIHTERRPVPLQHFLCVSGTREVHLVLDDKGHFFQDEFHKTMQQLPAKGDSALSDARKVGRKGGAQCHETAVTKAVDVVLTSGLAPVIVFAFNKRHTEFYARALINANLLSTDKEENPKKSSKLVTDVEHGHIKEICRNALETLSVGDRELPQVKDVCNWLSQGVGVHHGGLMPLVRELVELLFAEGFIKVLFATETFAMGLNMPARTVIFASLSKFDGERMRCLTPSEYVQMSGRAGRRGKDERGTVVLLVSTDTLPPPQDVGQSSASPEDAVHSLLLGRPEPLLSTFHLTNNMILQMMRVEQLHPEFIMRRSLLNFQNLARIPALAQEVAELQRSLSDNSSLSGECPAGLASTFVDILRGLDSVSADLWRRVLLVHNMGPHLAPGRVLKVASHGWVVLVEARVRFVKGQGTLASLSCLVPVTCPVSSSLTTTTKTPDKKKKRDDKTKTPPRTEPSTNPKETVKWKILKFQERDIRALSKAKMLLEGRTLEALESSEALRESLKPSWEKLLAAAGPHGLPELHPVKDLKLGGKEVEELVQKKQHLETRLNKVKEQLSSSSTSDKSPVVSESMLGQLETRLNKVKEQLSSSSTSDKSPVVSESMLRQLERQEATLKRLGEVNGEIDQRRALVHMEELRARQSLLRKLGYCSETGVLTLKGRVACEITSADEVLLTELLFHNFFHPLPVAEICAVLSCFLAEEKVAEENFWMKKQKAKAKKASKEEIDPVTERLKQLYSGVVAKIAEVCQASSDCGLMNALGRHSKVEEMQKEVQERYHAGIMRITLEWAQGKPFDEVCQINRRIFPGSIIRAMRRLCELLMQMQTAAKSLGNDELGLKFLAGHHAVRRNIVFTASLYL